MTMKLENYLLNFNSLSVPLNHDDVVTHLELNILACEVQWALGSIITNKASGGDRIPAELFQILKDDAMKVLHSICQQTWKTQQWPQDWKRSVFIQNPKKGNAKECSKYCTITLISHASKIMLKSFKSGFKGMWTEEFQMFKLDLEKSRGTRDQIANIRWIMEKSKRIPEKHLLLLH